MRVIVVGLGVQGYKRRHVAGSECVAVVDLVHPQADYKRVEDVPLDAYDAALCCIPDKPKLEILAFLLSNGKHVLVEKPLWMPQDGVMAHLQALARQNKAICYTAYNHRFEPHFVRMRDLIASGDLGRIYRCRMFYGNGTARLVRDSVWRDEGGGVLPDLGSHLLDTCRFWFGDAALDTFDVVSADRFENRAPDHVVLCSNGNAPRIELEMTLLMWRNHFTCDIFAEGGSAHIESLCKWGPTRFTQRKRILPSGKPTESVVTLEQPDPTWAIEYAYFKDLVARGQPTDLSHDGWLQTSLRTLSDRIATS